MDTNTQNNETLLESIVAETDSIDTKSRAPWGLRLGFGIVWLLLGVAIINVPVIATFGFIVLLGYTLLFAGLIQAAYALFNWDEAGSWRFMSGILFTVIGLLVVNNTVESILPITSLMGLFFIIQGLLSLTVAATTRSQRGLVIYSGLISVFFGILIFTNLLGDSIILLGLLLGLNMILDGFMLILNATYADVHPGTAQKIVGGIVLFFVAIFFLSALAESSDRESMRDKHTQVVPITESTTPVDDNIVAARIAGNVIYDSEFEESDMVAHCDAVGGTFESCGPNLCQIKALFSDVAEVCPQQCGQVCVVEDAVVRAVE